MDVRHPGVQPQSAEVLQQHPRAHSPNRVPLTYFCAGWKLQQLRLTPTSWYFLACYTTKQWREGGKKVFQASVSLIQMAEFPSCFTKQTSGQMCGILKKNRNSSICCICLGLLCTSMYLGWKSKCKESGVKRCYFPHVYKVGKLSNTVWWGYVHKFDAGRRCPILRVGNLA